MLYFMPLKFGIYFTSNMFVLKTVNLSCRTTLSRPCTFLLHCSFFNKSFLWCTFILCSNFCFFFFLTFNLFFRSWSHSDSSILGHKTSIFSMADSVLLIHFLSLITHFSTCFLSLNIDSCYMYPLF